VIETDEATHHEGQLSAAHMAYAVAADPQFRVPVRPCLVPGLVRILLPDGLAFLGTGNRHSALRGRTAISLIPRLLPTLDGTRTLAELAETHADVAPRTLSACVSLLYVSGLLQDGPAGTDVELIPAEVAGYLGRNLDTTRVNRNLNEACERLAQTRVLIAGPEPLAVQLGAELAVAGVDTRGLPAGGAIGAGDLGAGDIGPGDFLVAVDDGDTEALAELDEACRRAGIAWLRVASGESTVEVGPLFDARHTCCYRCFAEGRPAPAGEPTPARVAAWAALTATEVVHLLSRVGLTPSVSGCAVFDLDDWTQSAVGAYARPGCPRCVPTDGPALQGPVLAHMYEQAVTFPPREWLNPKDHQGHYRPANAALQLYNKEYLGSPRIPLDDSPLAGLLLQTFGLRGTDSGQVSRWAPTGGNLGSPQAYVLALDVAGLAPGWYFYQRGDHSLARIRALSAPDGHAEAVWPGIGPERPAALVVLTGALDVVAAKYHDFAYRILGLDAGVALAQLAAVADEAGLTARFADRWDDTAIGTALHLDADSEPVTAVVALDRRNARA
jgi:SagB-type dehydrogenase family enzyme